MFRIKICGVTNVDDANTAIEAGADAIGLNFYRGSKRFIRAESARPIVETIGDQAQPVGVFVNMHAREICDVCRDSFINMVQLHGEIRPNRYQLAVGLSDSKISIIRAHSFGASGMAGLYRDMFDDSGDAADALLVDAEVSGMYGGTGKTVDWYALVNFEKSIGRMPLILAGGLTPENVAEAIRIVRPFGVDVASGVEREPGIKDPALITRFVSSAKEAFARL